ncbi:Hypothetical predicted protein [Marmota monax]|uniref:Uncharacterized protein n=1 Tax=Marmota monax TaxID=9995 RepID=A0A5E4A4C5_MARMO|nr:hypothetical protein GHT09_010340 [Marmota monax]VTJ51572.1 Hypothetical predicted protein [Marmota monax]
MGLKKLSPARHPGALEVKENQAKPGGCTVQGAQAYHPTLWVPAAVARWWLRVQTFSSTDPKLL